MRRAYRLRTASVNSLYVMHFPATLRNYNGIIAYNSGMFDQKNGLLASDSRDDFRGGRTSLLLPPGAENTSYATGHNALPSPAVQFSGGGTRPPCPRRDLRLWEPGTFFSRWNRLDQQTVGASSLNVFKTNLSMIRNTRMGSLHGLIPGGVSYR